MPRSALDSTYPPFHFILRTNAINSQFVDGENEAQRLTCFVVDLEWEQDLQAYKAINSYLLGKCWIGKKGNKTTKQNNGHSAWKPVGRAVMEFSPVPRCSPSVWQRLPRCGRDGFGFLFVQGQEEMHPWVSQGFPPFPFSGSGEQFSVLLRKIRLVSWVRPDN